MKIDIYKTLCANPHFADVHADSMTALAKSAVFAEFDANQTIFVRGDSPDGLYILVNGKVAIEVTASDGRIARVATLGPGAYFGELAVLDGGVRTADARATEKTALIRVTANAYHQHLLSDVNYTRRIIKELVSTVRGTDLQIERLSLKSVRQRIAALLLELQQESDDQSVIKITQAEIADRLVASREKVNVNLQDIARAGAIELARGKIRITDIDRLSGFVEQRSI